MAGLNLYNASKAAVRSFARTWANDFRDRKIRVNALSPGFTFNPLFEKLGMSELEIQAAIDSLPSPFPLATWQGEIATAALFLASHDSKYVNGIELTVDGGVSQI